MPWEPQPGPQSSAILADWCPEIFYGGERGGGKSDFQIGYQEDGALQYGQYSRGIMFRKTYPELEELQERAAQVFPKSGAVFKTQPSSDYPFSNCWYWPNGASVKMRYIEHERDYGRYHGHQYTRISFDEVTEYATPDGLLRMLSTLRSAHGVPCSVRLTGNPGGKGHGWVKARYIEVGPPMTPYKDPDSGMVRMFVPSRMSDNKILLESDPDYATRILAATGGNDILRKAWLHGDWNVVAGAFFNNWSSKRHVIEPFEIPKHWGRFRSCDWGSAKPFSVGWWAVVTDDYLTKEGLTLPRGCLVRYREWYGMAKTDSGQPMYNTGLKLTAEKVAAGILEREHNEDIGLSVIDPAAFSSQSGPSIAERMMTESKNKIVWRRADNARVGRDGHIGGWDQVRARLDGEAEDRPMLVMFSTCTDAIRTVPTQQHDVLNPEDMDTDGEDHAADEIRYACMSRPYIKKVERPQEPRYPTEQKFSEILNSHLNRRKGDD